MKSLLLALALALAWHPAPANEAPAPGMKLVGQARLSVLFWDIYQSALYTPSGRFHGISAPLQLKLVYLRDIPAQDLVKATREQWQKLGLYQPGMEAWLDQLATMWPNVRPGDSITLDWQDPLHSRFYYNGQLVGSIRDAEFGRLFAAIWLSEKTEFPKLRKQLIGDPS